MHKAKNKKVKWNEHFKYVKINLSRSSKLMLEWSSLSLSFILDKNNKVKHHIREKPINSVHWDFELKVVSWL